MKHLLSDLFNTPGFVKDGGSEPALRRAIELDYEMIGGRLSIRAKESMLLYLLQQLPLFGNEGRLRHNQLVLANEAELQGVFRRLHIDF